MRRLKKTQKADKRKVPRSHLVFYLRVFDKDGTRIVGHLVDISRRGLMLVCYEPIEKGRTMTLRMRLLKELDGRQELVVEATCRWCRRDANPDFYIAGFKFAEISPDLIAHLQQLSATFSIEESLQEAASGRPACSLSHTGTIS